MADELRMGDDQRAGDESGYAAHRREQARMGLRLTPAERLRWLEETMRTLRRWQGRARTASRAREDPRGASLLHGSGAIVSPAGSPDVEASSW